MISRPGFGVKLWFWMFNFPNGAPLRGCIPCIWTEYVSQNSDVKAITDIKSRFLEKSAKLSIFYG